MTTDLVLHFGDPQAVPILFWILCGAGILIGTALFLLFRFPRFRRPELAAREPYPRLGLASGILAAAIFAALGWQASWGGFFTLTTHSSGATLYFRVPARSVEILPGAVVSLGVDPEEKGSGVRLVVRDRGGRVFRSTRVSREAAEGALAVLKPRLLTLTDAPGDGS